MGLQEHGEEFDVFGVEILNPVFRTDEESAAEAPADIIQEACLRFLFLPTPGDGEKIGHESPLG